MKVLVACEYSGRVREAFRKRGHFAMSCDLLPAETKGCHWQGDVREILDEGWDLLIAFPDCTYLCSSGMHWTTRGLRDPQLTEDALSFVKLLLAAPIEKKALENPIGCISTRIRKPSQIIQPWQFGDDASKSTCLWLENLPLLVPSNIVEPRYICCGKEVRIEANFENVVRKDTMVCDVCAGINKAKPRWANQTNNGQNRLGPSDDRWKERSRTYQGIADAMAKQWG